MSWRIVWVRVSFRFQNAKCRKGVLKQCVFGEMYPGPVPTAKPKHIIIIAGA